MSRGACASVALDAEEESLDRLRGLNETKMRASEAAEAVDGMMPSLMLQ
jgi:hypothetical protein